MKTYIKDLIVHLESLFPPEYQENYDNSGFLAGNMLSEVKAVMVCLNVTQDVIDEAIAKNCNLIISHHPLIFSGLKKITGSSLVERLVEQVIRSNMAVYAIHTNADNTFPGLNSHIASKLGMNNVEVLAPQKGNLRKIVTFCPADHAEKVRTALFDAGAGGIGKYDSCSFNAEGFGTFRGSDETQPFKGVPGEFSYEKEVRIETIFPHYLQKKIIHALFNSHPYEEVAYDIYALENQNPNFGSGVTGLLELPMDKEDFLKHVQSVFQTKFLKFSGACNNIKKVAICGGSGSFLISQAQSAHADAFITSDLKYHEFDHGKANFILVDAGHYETELFFKEYIVGVLTEKFTNFAIHFSESEKNHVLYY